MDEDRVCNAREHGLKGDGQAHDQRARAALVDELGRACKADGRPRVIFCPPGAYRIAGATTAWRTGAPLTAAGAGGARVSLAGGPAPAPYFFARRGRRPAPRRPRPGAPAPRSPAPAKARGFSLGRAPPLRQAV